MCSLMDQRTYQIIGAAIEVHKELGRGFLEPVYQEALELESAIAGYLFSRRRNYRYSTKGESSKPTIGLTSYVTTMLLSR